jgi:hypothetical protein
MLSLMCASVVDDHFMRFAARAFYEVTFVKPQI